MNRMRENPAEQDGKPAKGEGTKAGPRLPRALIGVLNGSFLTREHVLGNMPFILFVAGLMLCYIGYGYWTERTVRELERTRTELNEMRAEYLTIQARLDEAEQQSEVGEQIGAMGLEDSRVPPYRITVPAEQLERKTEE
jgi:hypothetical protein